MNTQTIVISIVTCIILGVLGYFAYGQLNSSNTSLTVTSASSSASVQDAELLATLQRLKSITLDANIFSDPTFQSLFNFGVKIPTQPLGRTNPFAPLASSKQASAGSSLSGIIKASSITSTSKAAPKKKSVVSPSKTAPSTQAPLDAVAPIDAPSDTQTAQ